MRNALNLYDANKSSWWDPSACGASSISWRNWILIIYWQFGARSDHYWVWEGFEDNELGDGEAEKTEISRPLSITIKNRRNQLGKRTSLRQYDGRPGRKAATSRICRCAANLSIEIGVDAFLRCGAHDVWTSKDHSSLCGSMPEAGSPTVTDSWRDNCNLTAAWRPSNLDRHQTSRKNGRCRFSLLQINSKKDLKGYITIPYRDFNKEFSEKGAPGKCVSEYLFRDTTVDINCTDIDIWRSPSSMHATEIILPTHHTP